jgi:flagellar biosynthetic protein FlhB
MADNDSAQERTERATSKRRGDARRKGQVPESKELSTMFVLVSAAATLLLTGGFMLDRISAILRRGFSIERELIFDSGLLWGTLTGHATEALLTLLPLLAVVAVAAIASHVSMSGWLFTTEKFGFKLSKFNPIQGIKKIFSLNGLMELVKALIKFMLVAGTAMTVIWGFSGRIFRLNAQPLETALPHAGQMLGWTFLLLTVVLLLVVVVDVPFQRWSYEKRLRMTKQEIKDEYKDTEGKPEVKSRIRRMQQEMAMQRMMAAVPKADVVVTNPTHFAVALSYDQGRMAAPRLVAKGADLVAARIREVAMENGVPIFSAPPLARAIFFNVRLDQEVPAGLYIAVAQVLAYVFQLRNVAQSGGGMPPPPPTDLPVPEEFLRRAARKGGG